MSRRVVGNRAILLINGVSFVLAYLGMHRNIFVAELPPHLEKGGHWQFLTNLSLVYSLVVFGVGFLAHLFHSSLLFNIKNNLHPVGLALESIVTVVYWPLRLFFLHLLIKDPAEFNIPIPVDLAIHLLPFVSLLVDYLVFMPRWTIKNSTALGLVVVLATGYYYLLENLIDVEAGARYPYAFLEGSDEKRLVVFAIITAVSYVQFVLLKTLYPLVVKGTEEVDNRIDGKKTV